MEHSQLSSGSSRQIAACIVASLPVFMAGIVLGWPSPVMEYMSAGQAPVSLTSAQMSWMVACIDIGNFAMAVPAGWLMDQIGRKYAVTASAPIMFVGWMFILFGRQVWCLFVARLLHGAAVGIAWVVAPAYVGEMASIRIRGKLSLLVQLSYALGLLFSYFAGWLLGDYITLTIASACVSVMSGVLFLFLPESPYYLMLDGRPDDAAKCLWSLRSYTDDDLQTELLSVKDSISNNRNKGSIGDLLNRDRWPLVIVIVLAVLQMACGAGVLEAYAASIMSNTRISTNALAVYLGLVVLVAAVPFALVVDRCGRRPLMIVSCFGTAACHASVATVLWCRDVVGHSWLPLFGSIAGAQFFINVGLMPLLSVVQCEYFPSDTRALADTAVVMAVTITSTVMITTYQPLADALGVSANFIVYSVASLAGGLFCCLFMPETKRKSFAEIQVDFHKTEQLADSGVQKLCDYQEI
ncbi:sugar transporter ERD6-like 6 [Rhopalosiphum maidis]|uniref:sugar transporter ERD6-like 6 n=1 Tax=Rhopalosiphum maidis TaxID=43146 RepID=UPI000EFF7416|nr:sugar transporter ERD6-like 6 [Rhopalosiphum maidis]